MIGTLQQSIDVIAHDKVNADASEKSQLMYTVGKAPNAYIISVDEINEARRDVVSIPHEIWC